MGEIAKREENAVDVWNPSGVNGTGFENVDSDCVSMPYLKLAQATTDQAKRGHPKYIEGLEPGKYFNSNSGQIYGGQFIVLGFIRQFIEYDGCGLKAKYVRSYTSDEYLRDIAPRTTRKEVDGKTYTVDAASGHSFVDTRNLFVLAADHPEDGVLVSSHRSSGIGASKKWISAMASKRVKDAEGRIVRSPIFTNVWAPRVELMTGDGNSWYQYAAVDCVCTVPPELRSTVVAAFDEVQEFINSAKHIAADTDAEDAVKGVFGE